MSRRIIRDIEEALSREVRRVTFFNDRTQSLTILQDTFDPITGEVIQTEVEPNFYDSSANTNNIQYPHFFVKLLKTREDRFTGRETSYYGAESGIGCEQGVTSSFKIYEGVLYSSDGRIDTVGNILKTDNYKIGKVQVGHLLRVLSGNNIGTYKISAITKNSGIPHEIQVSNELLVNLPELGFISSTRVITFLDIVDLNGIKIGDVFRDSSSVNYNITGISLNSNSITIDGSTSPSLLSGGKVVRVGNVFQTVDPSVVSFNVLDGTKPISGKYTHSEVVNPSIPIDFYYQVRIDSKQRDTHIDILNRIWEEFNPPRSGLPVVIRTASSAEELLTVDITSGGSSNVVVGDNSKFNIGDSICIIDNFTPTKSSSGGFEELYEAKIIGKIGTTQLVLDISAPDTFKIENDARIISNYEFRILFLHFVDHITKDVESAQYWVHEIVFWVQGWIDRLGDPTDFDGVIQEIRTPLESIEGYVYTN